MFLPPSHMGKHSLLKSIKGVLYSLKDLVVDHSIVKDNFWVQPHRYRLASCFVFHSNSSVQFISNQTFPHVPISCRSLVVSKHMHSSPESGYRVNGCIKTKQNKQQTNTISVMVVISSQTRSRKYECEKWIPQNTAVKHAHTDKFEQKLAWHHTYTVLTVCLQCL